MRKLIQITNCPHYNLGVISYVASMEETASGWEYVTGPDIKKAKYYANIQPDQQTKELSAFKDLNKNCSIKFIGVRD